MTQRGFTLIEIMLAILLLALLLAGTYGSVRTVVRATHSGEDVIDHVNRLRVAQEFLRHQISRILPMPFGQEDGTNNIVFQGEGDFMRFVAPMPGYLSYGGAYVQTLKLVNGSNGLQMQYTHALLNGFDLEKPSEAEEEPVVLLDQMQEARFEYRAFDEEGQLTDWSDQWEDSSLTPVMVRIAVTLRPETHTVWPNMEIPLLLDTSAVRQTLPNPLRRASQRSNGGHNITGAEP